MPASWQMLKRGETLNGRHAPRDPVIAPMEPGHVTRMFELARDLDADGVSIEVDREIEELMEAAQSESAATQIMTIDDFSRSPVAQDPGFAFKTGSGIAPRMPAGRMVQ